jgi:hypothetical protein
MNKKMSNKFIINFVKNSFHKVESFFSVGNEDVVFTEDSKCFPIKEVEIFETGTLIKVLNKTLTEDMVMSMMVDPDTGEKISW